MQRLLAFSIRRQHINVLTSQAGSKRLFSMTGIQFGTARFLLDRVPEIDRAGVVRDVASSLNAESRDVDVSFAVALLQLQDDKVAREVILSRITALIENGEHGLVASLCSDHSELRDEVTRLSGTYISDFTTIAQEESGDLLAMSVKSKSRSRPNGFAVNTTVQAPHTVNQAARYLAFTDRLLTADFGDSAATALFDDCLVLVGAIDDKLCTQASEVLFSLLQSKPGLFTTRQSELWSRILELVRAKKMLHKTLGYSLWLRWISSGQAIDPALLEKDEYWSALVDGLRHGDSERRKSCLQVLRASVDICVLEPSLVSTIAAEAHSSENFQPELGKHHHFPKLTAVHSIRKQYLRFCTVFETIVLGRYLNQVHECQSDLDFLASSSSAVKPAFLFALLDSALDQRMQEANRKWIGSWCLQSDLRTDDVDKFLAFLRYTLLPWATSGYLFTSTLRNVDKLVYCEHGERLAGYVSTGILKYRHLANQLIGSVAASIRSRHTNSFAYSTVYLVEGIGRALDLDGTLEIDSRHLEDIHAAATWIGLPEVARDHLLARTWKMCSIQHQRDTGQSSDNFIDKATCDWKMLMSKAASLGSEASVENEGSIGSLSLSPSKRDINEQKAHQKYVDLSNTVGNLDTADIEDRLEDIWSDLEYLEYPKGLLSSLPKLFLHKQLISLASRSPSSLTEFVTNKIDNLLDLAKSRSYMLPTLLETLRASIIADPKSALLLHLDDLILEVANNPPSMSLDAKLEAATIPVLQSVAPELTKFNYTYYFGQREGYGLAVLLDLVSRLRSIDSQLPVELFNKLLQKFLKQKTPPPSVSVWKKVLQLQIMLLCAEQHVPYVSQDEGRQILKDLHYILAIEPLPRYRYLLEWMIARTYIHHPELRSTIFEELRTKDHHSNPKFLASLMKIGVNIAKTENSNEDFALQLATVFVPLAASSKVVIRHEAQWQVPILLDHARTKSWKAITESSAFEALDEFIRSLERYGDPPTERTIDKLDPIKDHNLTHLVEGPWTDLDNIERRQTSHEDFITLYQRDSSNENNLPSSCIPLGDVLPVQISKSNLATSQTPIDHEKRMLQNIDNISRALGSGAAEASSVTIALQTKGTGYLSSSSSRHRHSNLLVVASLVDNPYNLGGLSRVSEIFGAGTLYVGNPQVTSNKDFQGVSVASHLHIPLKALLPKDLEGWLQVKKKEEGFKVVGIEQTDRSVLLGEKECVLPEKCILVIGSEREGIPAMVLSECDLLVEIPQIGITRSLNVQTAAGIVLCEYAKQFRKV